MTGRRGVLGLLLTLAAGPLAAQEAPAPDTAPNLAPPRPRPRRRAVRRRPVEPAPAGEAFTVPAPGAAPPAAAAGPRWEPAPLPDRALEAPGPLAAPTGPTFSPDLLTPRGTPRGQSFEGEQTPRQDRLFLQPAPGATLRVPFSY